MKTLDEQTTVCADESARNVAVGPTLRNDLYTAQPPVRGPHSQFSQAGTHYCCQMQSVPDAVPTPASRSDRALATIGIWLVVLSTIALLPGAMDRWLLPKVAVAVIGCVVASCSGRTGRIPRSVALLLALGAIVLLAAAFAGSEPLSQLAGRWPRYEGLVTLPAYAAALWTGARSVGPAAPLWRRDVVYGAVAVAAVALGFVSLLESVGLRPIDSNLERPGALLGNASDQGVIGVICFAILIVASLGRVGAGGSLLHRWYPAAGAALGVVTVVLSESRADLAALLVVCVLGIVVVALGYRRRAGRRAIIVALAAIIAGSVALTLALPAVRNRIFSGGSLINIFSDDRGALWQETFRMIAAHPLLGVGPSGFVDALPAYTTPSWFRTTGLGVTTDSPHSALLQAAVAGGIPLAVLAVALVIATIALAIRRIRSGGIGEQGELVLGALLALIGFGVALLATFTTPGTTVLAAFLAGIVVSVAPLPTRTVTATRARTIGTGRAIRTVLLSIWAAAIVVTTAAEVPLQNGATDAANGDISSALTNFETARALRPWDSDITVIEAQDLTEAAQDGAKGAESQALLWARVAHTQLPDSVLAAKSLAAAEQQNGDLLAATRTAVALNDTAPNDPQTLARLGALYVERGLFTRAQPVLEKAVKLDPHDGASWKTLGSVYESLGNAAGVARVDAVLKKLAAGG